MSDFNADNVNIIKTIDARGSACPGPLLEAKKGIGSVRKGETIEILSGDASTKQDLPLWANKVGHIFEGIIEEDGYDRIVITRGK